MAEIAGLALGVIGLAGLIGGFKDTIDLLSLVADSRHLGRDYQILETKLDIEKTLLLQWADRVKLLRDDYDRRLDDPETRKLVSQIFASLSSLLTDSNSLQQRYGLSVTRAIELDESSDGAMTSWRISQQRMAAFNRDFAALQVRVDIRGNTVSTLKKTRWVIRDKQKFSHLVTELAHFTARLNDVVPASYESTLSMVVHDLAVIKADLGRLMIVLESSAGQYQAITESTQRAIEKLCQERILKRLWFRLIDDRMEGISAAHLKTLEWALQPPDGTSSWDNLAEWLRHGTGIYWVCGKAGSGKSTLMKYLCSHHRTAKLLSEWAGGGPYRLCSFFFLNLGSDEQKTQQGLSRTLLHQVLEAHAWLIQEALPKMWKEVLDGEPRGRGQGLRSADDIQLPSVAETKYAFDIITRNTARLGHLCFFIDGLDEFAGDYTDGITFIKNLLANNLIKIVVSSRPIPACIAAFRNAPCLRVQDMTRDDIESYVDDVVGSHPSLKKHMRRFPEEVAALLSELVSKSSGVFLWVILACRSIVEGFTDHDRLSEIRRRVDELPPELEDMFSHMLRKVPKRHVDQGAQLLRICYTHQKTDTPFLRKDLYALGLALVEDYHRLSIQMPFLTNEDKADMCEELEGRLRSRCGGLLEFAPDKSASLTSASLYRVGADQESLRPLINARVEFMHRTVFEFLSDDDVWKLECLKTRNKEFDGGTALSLYGIQVATQLLYLERDVQAMDHFEEGLWWGVRADRNSPGDPRNCFFHLRTFLNVLSGIESLHAQTLRRLSKASKHELTHPIPAVPFQLAVEAGALNFVQRHTDFRATRLTRGHPCGCQPILYHTFRNQFLSPAFKKDSWAISSEFVDMAGLLLSSGSVPNDLVDTYGGATSTWSLWLEDIDLLGQIGRSSLNEKSKLGLLSLAEQFLRAGAENPPKDFQPEHLRRLFQDVISGGECYQEVLEKAHIVLDLCSPDSD